MKVIFLDGCGCDNKDCTCCGGDQGGGDQGDSDQTGGGCDSGSCS